MRGLLGICLLALLASTASAEKIIRLQGFSIEGGSEEPNVIYVTPWSPPPGTDRLFAPMKSYRDHWLKPVDGNVMRREVEYSKRKRMVSEASEKE